MVFMPLSMSSILLGDLNKYLKVLHIHTQKMWVLVSSIGKFFCLQIRDQGFNHCLQVSWFDNKKQLSGANIISWNCLLKKKKKHTQKINSNLPPFY